MDYIEDKKILHKFINDYSHTVYRPKMQQMVVHILNHISAMGAIKPDLLKTNIKNMTEMAPVVPVEREPVKPTTLGERRESFHQLHLESLDNYRTRRRNGLLKYFRDRNVNKLYQQKLQAIVDNETNRMRIIK